MSGKGEEDKTINAPTVETVGAEETAPGPSNATTAAGHPSTPESEGKGSESVISPDGKKLTKAEKTKAWKEKQRKDKEAKKASKSDSAKKDQYGRQYQTGAHERDTRARARAEKQDESLADDLRHTRQRGQATSA